MRFKSKTLFPLFAFAVYGWGTVANSVAPQKTAQDPNAIRFTATTANVSGAGETIKINLSAWSTDADRDEIVNAWTLKPPPSQPVTEARGGRGAAAGGAGGRGGRGGRGGDADPVDPAAVDPDNPAFRFGRGGARGRGGANSDDPPATPQSSLTAALKKKRTVGMLWTSQIVGYSIKFAYRIPQPDGGERVILATDRRVGAWSNQWRPVGPTDVADYGFSIIELRLNSKGEGEGKISMNGKIAVDTAAKTLALDGYGAAPVIFKGVKRKNE